MYDHDDVVEQAETDHHIVKVLTDESDDNPVNMMDFMGTVICVHSRYNIGHEHSFTSEDDFVHDLMDWDLDNYYWDEDEEVWLDENDEPIDGDPEDEEPSVDDYDGVVLSVYIYDHSGITINTHGFSCNWDSGQVGWIYASREDLEKEGYKIDDPEERERAVKLLVGEIETIDRHLTNRVYMYQITSKLTGEIVDSVGGYYMESEEVLEEAVEMAKSFDKSIQSKSQTSLPL